MKPRTNVECWCARPRPRLRLHQSDLLPCIPHRRRLIHLQGRSICPFQLQCPTLIKELRDGWHGLHFQFQLQIDLMAGCGQHQLRQEAHKTRVFLHVGKVAFEGYMDRPGDSAPAEMGLQEAPKVAWLQVHEAAVQMVRVGALLRAHVVQPFDCAVRQPWPHAVPDVVRVAAHGNGVGLAVDEPACAQQPRVDMRMVCMAGPVHGVESILVYGLCQVCTLAEDQLVDLETQFGGEFAE